MVSVFFSCGKQFCQSICLCGYDSFVAIFLLSNHHETYIRHPSHEILVACTISGQRVNVTGIVQSFCCIRSMALCLFAPFTSNWTQISPMRWQCVVHIQRVKVIVTWVIQNQGYMGCSKLLQCPFNSWMPIRLICFICRTNTTHVDTLCTAFSRSLNQRSRSQGLFEDFVMFALCLFDQFISYVA